MTSLSGGVWRGCSVRRGVAGKEWACVVGAWLEHLSVSAMGQRRGRGFAVAGPFPFLCVALTATATLHVMHANNMHI